MEQCTYCRGSADMLMVMKSLLACITAMAAGTAASAANPASFRWLELPPQYESYASALSPDGSVIMGEMWGPAGVPEIFRWTAKEGLIRQADIPAWGGYAWPTAMSFDGSVVVGYDTYPALSDGHAFQWTSTTGRTYLDDPPQVAQSEAWGMSWDGASIVGYEMLADGSQQPALWRNGNAVALGSMDGIRGAFTGISCTGTLVGFSYSSSGAVPFRYSEQEGLMPVDLPASVHFDSGPRISADGSTIVGCWRTATGANEAFIWNQHTGATGLGDLPGGADWSAASGVSADGRIVVGASMTGTIDLGDGFTMGITTAFIWDPAHGMRSLPSVLVEQYGLNLQGWELREATAISPDGRIIRGYGINPEGRQGTWIAQIPEPATLLPMAMIFTLLHRLRRSTPVKPPSQ